MAETIGGRCACSAVVFELEGLLRPLVACHCEQCRRTSGHFVAATAVRRRHFRLLKQSGLRWYSAIPGFRRGFCDRCGSSLFFEQLGADRVSVAAGSLESTCGLRIDAHIFTAEAGEYYSIDEAVEQSAAGKHSVDLP